MKKSPGLEQFEHLNDKSNLLLFMLEDEAKEIDDLRNSINVLRNERNEVRKINQEMNSRIDSLREKQLEIDVKAGVLLKALDEAYSS